MDLARITPFIQSVHHVFETMLQLPVEIGQPQWLDAGGTPHDVVVATEVAGSCEGSVAIGFDEGTAERIFALLTGSEIASGSADLADAAREMLVMICGSARARLPGGRTVFSMPIVEYRANPMATPERNGAPVVVLPCETDCGQFRVELSLEGPGEVASRGAHAACAGASISEGDVR